MQPFHVHQPEGKYLAPLLHVLDLILTSWYSGVNDLHVHGWELWHRLSARVRAELVGINSVATRF
jgi:hypothetical protein